MSEIYHGVSLPDAYRAIAHDLGGMRVMVHLALGPEDARVRDRYIRDLVCREHDLINLADHPTPVGWRTTILNRINELLYEIYLLIQLPLWQYVMRCPEPVGVITVVRNDRRS